MTNGSENRKSYAVRRHNGNAPTGLNEAIKPVRFRALCALPAYQTGEVDRGMLGDNGTTSPNELVVTGPAPG